MKTVCNMRGQISHTEKLQLVLKFCIASVHLKKCRQSCMYTVMMTKLIFFNVFIFQIGNWI